jgi:hypothetical protein
MNRIILFFIKQKRSVLNLSMFLQTASLILRVFIHPIKMNDQSKKWKLEVNGECCVCVCVWERERSILNSSSSWSIDAFSRDFGKGISAYLRDYWDKVEGWIYHVYLKQERITFIVQLFLCPFLINQIDQHSFSIKICELSILFQYSQQKKIGLHAVSFEHRNTKKYQTKNSKI